MRTKNLAIVAAIVAICSCLSFSCGGGSAIWWAKGDSEAKAGDPAAKADKEHENADAKNAAEHKREKSAKPIGQWGFQDIQDHLAKNGWKTSRGMSARGMMFMDGDGAPIDTSKFPINDRDFAGIMLNGNGDDGVFVATKMRIPEEAAVAAREYKDVGQRECLAWHQFFFQGNSKTLTKLKKMLR